MGAPLGLCQNIVAHLGLRPHLPHQLKGIGAYLLVHCTVSPGTLLQDCGGIVSDKTDSLSEECSW